MLLFLHADVALQIRDAVERGRVGSTDGGYVLLGPWESYKELFRGIEWYTVTVYRETIGKARALGLRRHEGDPHYDMDTPKTWSTSKKSSKKAPIRPHTRRSS